MPADLRASRTGEGNERRLTPEYIAARALVEATTLDEAAPKILSAIGDGLGWDYASLWTIDHEIDALRCVHSWTTPAAAFPEFDAASRAATFRRGVGLPGRVWATGEPAWIRDVVTDANFPRAPVAAREGLHAAVCFPILLRGEVLNVLEFFNREIREPDAPLLSTLATVGHQIGMFIDRHRAEEELARFFALSLDMLGVAGFDGYFKHVNRAWQRLLGWSSEELLSRPYLEFVHPDDREATIREAGNLTEGKEVIYFENRYLHKDGTYRWLLWASAPYREQQVIYAAARDITDRKAAEETLARYARDLTTTHRELEDQAARLAQLVKELEVAKRRAEEAADAKSAFLAHMSHEIRTPLNAVLGMTALALQTRLTAEQREYLETAKTSAESLLGIINDVLDFSKIEARRLDLERVEFDVRETIGEAAKLLALRAAEKGIELACHIAADVPHTLLGDPGRLSQVLLNILGNAVKFTDRGEVVLDATVAATDASGITLQFAVRDTGIGIPAERQRQIFQAFTQADASTTRRFGGTGLGLAIAQRLVELMNGEIRIESEPGRGSTFRFSARFDCPVDRRRVPMPGPRALDGLRVLVVDDNATSRRILEEMLASWRMTGTAMADAGAALDALRQPRSNPRRFDAVIVDCDMPAIDGFTLARQIKRDARLRRTPVIMLMAAGRAGDAARCRRIGVDASITKPVKHSDLLDALVTLFRASARRATRAGSSAATHAAPTRAARRLRILVAEDNAVNRKLVTTLLQKRGHQVTAVSDGREAVDAIDARGSAFDVLLLDVQMPVMSGFEAAQAIRDRETATRRHLPIVALTAHAMPADRDRCLAAGMDAYLPKPINVDDLIETVEGFAPGKRKAAKRKAAAAPASEAASHVVFDHNAALARTAGDRRLLLEMIALFRSDAPGYMRRITSALKRQDAEALRLSAHALKGAFATIGSERGRQLAAELEQLGRAGRLDDGAAKVLRLRDHLKLLDDAFIAAGVLPRGTSRKRAFA